MDMSPVGSFWMTPHDIYVKLTTGPGSEKLDVAQAVTQAMWDGEKERAEIINRQAALIESGWQGAASDAASGAAYPLAQSAWAGVDQLSQAQDLMERQSGSFNRAKNDVRPVPPEPPEFDMFDPNFVFTDYEKQVTSYQADAQHNIDVFSNYDGASTYNETRMPADYSTITQSGGDISVVDDTSGRGDTGDPVGVTEYQQPRGGPGPSGESGQPSGGPTGGGSPVGPSPDAQQSSQTTPSDVAPPSVSTPGGPSPTPFPTSTSPGLGGLVTGAPVNNFPGGGTGGGTGGPGARGGGYGGGRPGAGGRGSGAGMRALGAGPGVGALAAEEAAAQRAAAAAAGRNAGQGAMGAPVGAGRGKGDEDEEHQRKVLLEIDPEGVFGTDVLTAPQVIGDDAYEED